MHIEIFGKCKTEISVLRIILYGLSEQPFSDIVGIIATANDDCFMPGVGVISRIY